MHKQELLSYFNNEDYGDYVKNYLVRHWKEKSSDGYWQDLVTDNFMDRHTVEGTVTKEKAVDICRSRSNNGTRGFTSTLITEALVKKVIRFIANNVIEWHGKNVKAFANYSIPVQGTMWTVVCTPNKGFEPTSYQDAVVVGINREGLINHFHGDARCAQPPFYAVTDGKKPTEIRLMDEKYP